MNAHVCFIDPLSTPLGRRSSYLCFANDNKGEQMIGKSTISPPAAEAAPAWQILTHPTTAAQFHWS